GASGALRQEFRELEMLDDITTLRYNGKLPAAVNGNSRNDLISAFHLKRGDKYVPSRVHQAICWKENDPFHLSDGTGANWKVMESSKPVANNHPKRKDAELEQGEDETRVKRSKTDLSNTTEGHTPTDSPQGSQWSNNSCVYDAVMSILYNIWRDDPTQRTIQFRDVNNEYLGQISRRLDLGVLHTVLKMSMILCDGACREPILQCLVGVDTQEFKLFFGYKSSCHIIVSTLPEWSSTG
ncbi:hypothetical protein L208DRAFT_1334627, partial [Tricholoma matsutake]